MKDFHLAPVDTEVRRWAESGSCSLLWVKVFGVSGRSPVPNVQLGRVSCDTEDSTGTLNEGESDAVEMKQPGPSNHTQAQIEMLNKQENN